MTTSDFDDGFKAANDRLRAILHGTKPKGTGIAAITLALGSPSMPAEDVIQLMTTLPVEKAQAHHRRGLTEAVTNVIGSRTPRGPKVESQQSRSGLARAVDEAVSPHP